MPFFLRGHAEDTDSTPLRVIFRLWRRYAIIVIYMFYTLKTYENRQKYSNSG
jgi:hypothetical protein